MDDLLAIIVITVGTGLACIGASHLAQDYREFDSIVKDCKTMGYVQNKNVRIDCKLEKNT